MPPRTHSRDLCRPTFSQAVAASDTEAVVVQELISGAMAAADAAAAASVAADSEAARRKERAEHKKQRKRHRDRGSHNKRTNARKNLRRSEGRKARARTRAQMAPVLSQLLHLSCSQQASELVEPRSSKQARPPLTYSVRCRPQYICATNELRPLFTFVMPGTRHA